MQSPYTHLVIITTNYIKHDIIWAICLSRHMSQIKLKGIMFSTPGKTSNKSKYARLRVSDSRPRMAISAISQAVHLFAQLKITVFQNQSLKCLSAYLCSWPFKNEGNLGLPIANDFCRPASALPGSYCFGKPLSALFDYKWLSNIRFKKMKYFIL